MEKTAQKEPREEYPSAIKRLGASVFYAYISFDCLKGSARVQDQAEYFRRKDEVGSTVLDWMSSHKPAVSIALSWASLTMLFGAASKLAESYRIASYKLGGVRSNPEPLLNGLGEMERPNGPLAPPRWVDGELVNSRTPRSSEADAELEDTALWAPKEDEQTRITALEAALSSHLRSVET